MQAEVLYFAMNTAALEKAWGLSLTMMIIVVAASFAAPD